MRRDGHSVVLIHAKTLDTACSYKPAVAVWTREYPKQAVIAIKGTSPKDVADDAADFNSIFLGSDFTMALERISELKTMYGSYNVLVTGARVANSATAGGGCAQHRSEETDDLEREAKHVQPKFWSFSGHSLGGYLAELSSTHYNIPGIAFHGPPPGGDNGR